MKLIALLIKKRYGNLVEKTKTKFAMLLGHQYSYAGVKRSELWSS